MEKTSDNNEKSGKVIREKKVTPKKPLDAVEEKLVALVDEHRNEIISLLQKLIEIDTRAYSVDVFSDMSKAVDFIGNELGKEGFSSETYYCPHRKESMGRWPNLIAKKAFNTDNTDNTDNTEKENRILQYNGHIDVVPFNESNWDPKTPPLKGTIVKSRMYGRGSSDMKGGVTAIISALKLFNKFISAPENNDLKKKVKGTLQLWVTPDEEIDGFYGSRFMTKNHFDIINAEATVIAEPTGYSPIQSPVLIIGEKGSQWFKLTFKGSAGHGSMPKKRSNAIVKAAKFISNLNKLKLPNVKPPLSLKDMLKTLLSRYSPGSMLKLISGSDEDTEPDPYDEDGLGIGSFFKTTISVNQIEAGDAVNVIPDTCSLKVDIRVLPGIETQEIFDALARYCAKLGYRIQFPEPYHNIMANKRGLRNRPADIFVDIISNTHGSFVDMSSSNFCNLLSDAFESVYNVKSAYFFAPGSSDAVYMRESGMKNVVLFGPLGGNAHTANEYINIPDLIKSTKVFLLTAYRFLTVQ